MNVPQQLLIDPVRSHFPEHLRYYAYIETLYYRKGGRFHSWYNIAFSDAYLVVHFLSLCPRIPLLIV